MIFQRHLAVKSLALLVLYLFTINATLTPKSRSSNKETKPKTIEERIGPQQYSVFHKNLVSEAVSPNDVLVNNKAFFKETDEHNFDGMVLGYVTPWNNHGYDVAKIFGNKFTHISPVWLQVKRKYIYKYVMSGLHDIDKKWIVHVKNAGRERKLKILPRILFDNWMEEDVSKLSKDSEELRALADTFIEICREYNFDGIVMEVWPILRANMDEVASVKLVKDLADALALEELQTILVIPPKRGEYNLFTNKHFDALYSSVEGFSLMTYDYSNVHEPGPNSPTNWMKECVESLTFDKNKRGKILMGLNFYGNDYHKHGGGPIVGHEFVKILQNNQGKIYYADDIEEHYLEYKDSKGPHMVFYPSLYSINKRIKLAEQLGTGLSIWELGQGLDYFYDLL